MLTCGNCGTQNEPTRKFCLECGQRLAQDCPSCGAANPAGAKFCGECGSGLGASPGVGAVSGASRMASAPGKTAAGVNEVRLISVMFVDLVGFTPLSERLDAEEIREMLDGYFSTAREIVDRHGGVVEKFIGDAVMAVWGTPVVHEDDAERAVRTALELVDAIGRIEVGGTALQGRAGVLTGEAVVTVGADGQWMVAGDLVNTAGRLQSVAAPGTVLVGEATYRAASGAIAFEPVGERELKGKTAPVACWQALNVVARRRGSGRSETVEPPFVGRDEELRALKDHFHATEREGKPRLVTVVGQAGIGKSRLAWELEKYLDGVVETILWHEGRSPSYGDGISYWALAEIVRGRAGIAESDDADTARARLGAMLEEMIPDAGERRWIEPRLTGLLGVDALPVESREELFAAWRTFFERLAEQSTTILIFWDLQWADQGLLDFIEHLLTWARSSPIFVVAEARPELFERRPGWGSVVRSSATIHLEPLSNEEMRLLLGGLVSGLPEHAMRAIVGRAEGVPLYAVETLRMLIDRGVLRPTDDGDRFTLAVELPELDVPATLQALIAARLDTLAPEDRSLLMDASVLGLSFTVPGLRALSTMDDAGVAASLDRLVRHQLLVLDADPRSPERGQFRFVQGVVREVAYQGIAKRDRRAKHVGAARYLESLGDDELAGVLANHYLAAFHAT
ncbi:MAG: AAA family ATPase, partial [Chloroflexota bacterium]